MNNPRTGSFLSFCCWIVTWSSGISIGVSAYLYYPVLIQRAVKMSLGTFSASLLVCLRVLLHLCPKFLRPEPAFITEFVNSILYCWEGKEIEEWELESAFTVVFSVVQVPWLMSWPYGNAGQEKYRGKTVCFPWRICLHFMGYSTIQTSANSVF